VLSMNDDIGNNLRTTTRQRKVPSRRTKQRRAGGELRRKRKRRKPRRESFLTNAHLWAVSFIALCCLISIKCGGLYKNRGYLRRHRFSSWTLGLRSNNDVNAPPNSLGNQGFILEHVSLYDTVYAAFKPTYVSESRKMEFDSETYSVGTSEPPWPSNSNLTSNYSEDVTKRGCPLTVVFMDPRLPILPVGSPAFFSLESVAAFVQGQPCVLLLTASCEVRDLLASRYDGDITEELARRVVMDRIYYNSLPLFRQLVDQGQVRVGFPDHEKYKLQSCSNFYNPSSALMNVNFWRDEFNNADSDFVLVRQSHLTHFWLQRTPILANCLSLQVLSLFVFTATSAHTG